MTILNFEGIIGPGSKKDVEDDNPKEIAQSEKISDEISALEQGQTDFINERNSLINKKERMHLIRMKLEMRMRQDFSKRVFCYLWVFSGFCATVLLLQGFNPDTDIHFHSDKFWNIEFRWHGFKLDAAPLTTLIGGTAASAIGLVAIVLRGLFNSTKDDDKPKEDKKSSS